MNKATLLILFFFVSLSSESYAQVDLTKHYNQWVFGYSKSENSFLGHNILDFNKGTVTLEEFVIDSELFIGSTGSYICDSLGQLLLVTNGCDIQDRDFNIIQGGEVINEYDTYYTGYCEIGFEYPMTKGTMLLPSANKNSTILLHSNVYYNSTEGLASENIYLKIIEQINGQLSVTKDTIITSGNYARGIKYLTPHNTMDAYWLIVRDLHSNKFSSYLINANGSFTRGANSTLGLEFLYHDQAAFSTLGDKLAINTLQGLMMYDFNMDTGALSNFKNYIYPNPYRSGVCFSPSGKYVYVTDQDYLYQIEVASDPQKPVIHNYGSLSTTYNNWPVGAGHMSTGPDCRMYISPSSSINMMHVIHKPDLPGEAADLQAHIPVPKRFSFDFPNIPNLFGSCDDTIEWGIETSALYPTLSDELVVLYPNPAEHETTVTLPAGQKGNLFVYTQNGAPLHRIEIEGHQTEISLDLSAWPSGMYIIQIRTQEGVASGKLVVR